MAQYFIEAMELLSIEMKGAFQHPNLILGLVTFFTLILAMGFKANHLNIIGDVLLMATFALGFVHWIWSIVDAMKHYHTNKGAEDRTIIWVILVVIVPPVDGMLFYGFNRNLGL